MGLIFARDTKTTLFTLTQHFLENPSLSASTRSALCKDGYLRVLGLGDTSDVTYECWVYLTNATDQMLIAKNYGDTPPYHVRNLLVQSDGRLRYIGFNGGVFSATSVGRVPQQKWTHVAVVHTNFTATFYFNGLLDSSFSVGNNPGVGQSSDAHLILGGNTERGNSGSPSLTGHLDDVRVWNGARSETQIAENYNRATLADTPAFRMQFEGDFTSSGSAAVTIANFGLTLSTNAPEILR